MLIFCAAMDIPNNLSRTDPALMSAKYNEWRNLHVLTPDEGEYKCPYMKKEEMGGYYVDDVYCKSHCLGKGCSKLDTCRARKRFLKKK